VVVFVIIGELAEEITHTQAIVIAVVVTVMFIPVIIVLFVIVIMRLSAFPVDLDVAALQGARSAVTVRECKAETVPVVAVPAVVDNNDRVGDGDSPVDHGRAFDFTGNGIDHGISSNLRPLDLRAPMVVERKVAPGFVVLYPAGDAERGFVLDPSSS